MKTGRTILGVAGAVSIACLLLDPGAVLARRPFQGDEANLTPRGRNEIEVGVESLRDSHPPFRYKKTSTPLRIARGVSDVLELGIEAGHASLAPENAASVSGMTDARIYAKHAIRPTSLAAGEHLSVRLEASLPTGDDQKSLLLGSGKTDVGLGAAYEAPIADNTRLLMSAGFTAVGKPQNTDWKNRMNFAVATEHTVSPVASVTAELYGKSRRAEAQESSEMAVALGVRRQGTRNVTWDASVAAGLTADTPDLAVRGGLNHRF